MTVSTEHLLSAISALGPKQRRPLIFVLVEQRDKDLSDYPAFSRFYNALAALVAEVSDHEARVLRDLETDAYPEEPDQEDRA